MKRQRADEARTAPTVAVAAEEFLELHCRPKLKPRSLEEYERTVRLIICPELGQHRVAVLTHADVTRLHHGLRATPVHANRVIKVLSKLLTWSIAHGYHPDRINPVRGLERFAEKKRERFLSEAELARLGQALTEACASDTLSPWAAAAIRLLLFTGAGAAGLT